MEKAPLYVKQYQTKTSWVKALTYKKNVGKSKAELLSPQLLSKQGTTKVQRQGTYAKGSEISYSH